MPLTTLLAKFSSNLEIPIFLKVQFIQLTGFLDYGRFLDPMQELVIQCLATSGAGEN